MSSRTDIVIFGATGYTGKYIVKKLHEISTKENVTLTWGIAGRSLQKLQQLSRELQCATVPIIIADSQDENSLMKMASKTRLIINCTGPYKFHGEPVVRACIRQKCHYIDVSAEPYFMERMQLLYEREAALEGVLVVPGCGMESVVPEMALVFLQEKFQGTINSVECYLELLPKDGTFGSKPLTTITTLEGMLYNFKDCSKAEKIRAQLFEKLPRLEPQLALKRLPHKAPMSENYAGPFPSADASVMRRSQYYFYKKNKSRPVQIHTYLATPQFWRVSICVLSFLILSVLAKFQFLIDLFLKYPKMFSGGVCGDATSIENTDKLKCVTTLYGRGWKNQNVDESHVEREDGWMVAKVTGFDAYEITAICTVASAIVLLDKSQKLPEVGGVYTPASLFKDTDLIQKLQRNGVKFEIVGEGDV